MNDDFSFKNRGILKWLFLVGIASLLLAVFAPPAFWLCGVGVVFLLIGLLANSARTNQYMSWQNEGALNWFEGWAVSTGAVLLIIPLAGVIFRSLAS